GNGGSIILKVDEGIRTLMDFRYKRAYKGQNGEDGRSKKQFGAKGEDIILKVPLGTLVKDEATGGVIVDLKEKDQTFVIVRGGRGGRGNGSLYSPRNPNPERSEPGKPGEEKKLRLVLKVLADIGLVGRPNAGKSTLLSTISAARPKIADYPFTTTEPHLGIVRMSGGYDSFVVADIPGLIEDCHKGKGLGIRFLKHIERTKVLAILVESSSPDPKADADTLINELSHYSESLAEKPKIFIMTKTDLITEDNPVKIPDGWLSISCATGDNIDTLLQHLHDLVKTTLAEDESEEVPLI
ncbi:MAG: GTPase ObgE, partial [Fibrobacter sp.]|nr:GTPase ObgE [Fibrobacter sp.]